MRPGRSGVAGWVVLPQGDCLQVGRSQHRQPAVGGGGRREDRRDSEGRRGEEGWRGRDRKMGEKGRGPGEGVEKRKGKKVRKTGRRKRGRQGRQGKGEGEKVNRVVKNLSMELLLPPNIACHQNIPTSSG